MSGEITCSMDDLATAINSEHRMCEAAFKAGCQHAVNAGKLLLEARTACAHGEWLPWLQQHFEGSERTAQAYMRVAREMPALANTQHVADLSFRQALALLSEPRPAAPSLAEAEATISGATMTEEEAREWLNRGRGLTHQLDTLGDDFRGTIRVVLDGLNERLQEATTLPECAEIARAAGEWEALLARQNGLIQEKILVITDGVDIGIGRILRSALRHGETGLASLVAACNERIAQLMEDR